MIFRGPFFVLVWFSSPLLSLMFWHMMHLCILGLASSRRSNLDDIIICLFLLAYLFFIHYFKTLNKNIEIKYYSNNSKCNDITFDFLFLKYKIIWIGNQSIVPNTITRIIKNKNLSITCSLLKLIFHFEYSAAK